MKYSDEFIPEIIGENRLDHDWRPIMIFNQTTEEEFYTALKIIDGRYIFAIDMNGEILKCGMESSAKAVVEYLKERDKAERRRNA